MRTFALLSGVALGALLSMTAANAARAEAKNDSDNKSATDVGEVVVTGSRIQRSGFETPTPVTVATTQALQLAAPTTISAGLKQLPQFRGSTRPEATVSSTTGAAGANQLNLRNMGVARTLTLLDGRRVVKSSSNYVVDINTLPESLVQRVEVVTGGASAAYGSDAVAGVVNFILDDKFDGLRATGQAGISTYGDVASYKASLTGGQAFADGRGHIMATGDYYNSEGIGFQVTNGRDWQERKAGLVPNVPGTAMPFRLTYADGVNSSTVTAGGLINRGPLDGTQFLPGGVAAPFVYGILRSPQLMIGGDPNATPRNEGSIAADLKRYSLFARATYEVSPFATVSLDAMYGKAITEFITFASQTGATPLTVFNDNPYLSDQFKARMASVGVTNFPLGRTLVEGGPIEGYNNTDVWQGTAAVKGKLNGRWSYDAYYSHGETGSSVANNNVMDWVNLTAATDAIRAPDGRIVCRSTFLFGSNPGCVPINLLGLGSPSAEALDYVLGNSSRELRTKLDAAALNFQAELFSLWSDQPAAVAFGAEWRKESSVQTVDANSAAIIQANNIRGVPTSLIGRPGRFLAGNPQASQGSVSVKEGFAELSLPIVSGRRFLQQFELNGALRLTDYSTSGSVTTWKVGASYKPFDDLRLRVTQSRDIRAPSIAELFTGPSTSGGTVRLPTGVTALADTTSVGSPVLDPEKADSLTVGAVLQPSFVPGFSLSVDYYSIDLKDAINRLSSQETIDACARGSADACSSIQIVGGTYRIRTQLRNLTQVKVEGVDVEMTYTRDMFGGNVTVRGLASYQPVLTFIQSSGTKIKRAGEVGNVGEPGTPKFLGTVSATYNTPTITFFIQERIFGKAKLSNAYVVGVDVDRNDIPSIGYTDIAVRYRPPAFDGKLEFTANVSNLFNMDPPLVPSTVASLSYNTHSPLYDVIGRYFTAGVRYQF